MNRSKISKLVKYGWLFLIASLVINYIYRMVFHTTPIEKIIIGSDMEGYFQYLVHFFTRDWSTFDQMRWTIGYGEGKSLSVFTCGVAILWSPFFLMAHIISIFFGLDTGGYANMYYGFMLVAGIVYTYIGLVFMYKFLREFFDHKVSLLTTSLFFLATNVFFYSVLLGAGMAHVYSFSMIAIYLYYCNQYSKESSLKNLILLGVPFALAVLIRPTNIISGLYLFLYGVSNFATLKERVTFWIKNYWAIIAMFIIGVIVFIPQMAYWHYVTGKFLVYSYQEYGFPNWNSPKFGIVLFGKYNGWLTYTPIVCFALVGLFILLWKKQMNSLAISLVLLIGIYVNASWWVPTFSAAVGQRAMIDFLPVLAVPLGFVINQINGMSRQIKIALGLVILIFIFYNIQFGFRYDSWMWWGSPMSWTKFWTTLKF
ncbi:MAG: glycosyltransferase family 39 protein [Bacteroidota bacterium]|nr:glycosyltransferase family 39 protein [Bacteroidota bacterium]